MAEKITPNFKLLLRRNTKPRWEKNEKPLLRGEPGFETDTGRLKIGDGIHKWKELPYIDRRDEILEEIKEKYALDLSVQNFNSEFDLNNFKEDKTKTKDKNKIYKVYETKTLYQWNEDTQSFEALNQGGESFDPTTIKFINGGNANG